MNCGILTFYFAHNYGAVLQAYALQTYITKLGCNAYIIKEYPKKLKTQYSISPFCESKTARQFLRKCKKLPRRLIQYYLFEKFIKMNFKSGSHNPDVLICGSDQIWNQKITGETALYYGGTYEGCPIKISYAASFGTKELSDFQINMSKEYLVNFQAISLRERDTESYLADLIGKEVRTVLDPVFLLSADYWRSFAQKSKRCADEKYILYYSLKEDSELIDKTELLSREIGCKIICIHPTCSDLHVNWKQLFNVGPYEFVSLIENAEVVATNSFHAMAFSVLLGKKALCKSFSSKDNRVESLLKTINYGYSAGTYLYDFSNKDMKLIDSCIYDSKMFLKSVIGDEMEKT